MENLSVYFNNLFSRGAKINSGRLSVIRSPHRQEGSRSVLWVMVHKEIADHIRSWRFIMLVSLIVLTFLGSMYVSLSHLGTAIAREANPENVFIYLKLLTTTDGSLPAFHIFISFLGALLGIGMGFDAINSEQNNGTLIRLMAQPVYRDNLLLSKFLGAFVVITVLFVSLTLLMTGSGLLITGVPMEPAECLRIAGFVGVSILYISFWLGLSILFSIQFRQAATSALLAIGVWLFFTIFYRILIQFAVRSFFPDPAFLSNEEMISWNNLLLNLLRLSPSQLYTDAVTTLLMPAVRSLGPLTMEQMAGAIPDPLPLRESLLIVWPQVTGLVAATTLCFAVSYYRFMRREIRS